jgi:hypothetical protein
MEAYARLLTHEAPYTAEPRGRAGGRASCAVRHHRDEPPQADSLAYSDAGQEAPSVALQCDDGVRQLRDLESKVTDILIAQCALHRDHRRRIAVLGATVTVAAVAGAANTSNSTIRHPLKNGSFLMLRSVPEKL